MTLSHNEIKMLAEGERMMDSGEVPFVILNGNRVMMTHSAMTEFELKQGQAITHVIFKAILEFNLADCQAKIALNKARPTQKHIGG